MLLLFLGFPTSKYSKYISISLIKELEKNTSYTKWKRIIKDKVVDIRIFRNHSVHSGFRNIDFSIRDLRLYYNIMFIGCSRCQSAVKTGLLNRIDNIDDFKEYAGIIFENRDGLINDILGNIVFSFDNDYMLNPEPVYI